jgi:2-iminobutanoate/2-iminopropanoate deaminase
MAGFSSAGRDRSIRKRRSRFAELKRILEAAGCTLNDVVKSTVHLADIEDFDRYNATYKQFFKDAAVLPARTTVQSVLWNGIKVEIDVIARKMG